MSVMENIKYIPMRVWTRVDRCGYTDTDRCSFAYARQWFASIHGQLYTDTGA